MVYKAAFKSAQDFERLAQRGSTAYFKLYVALSFIMKFSYIFATLRWTAVSIRLLATTLPVNSRKEIKSQ